MRKSLRYIVILTLLFCSACYSELNKKEELEIGLINLKTYDVAYKEFVLQYITEETDLGYPIRGIVLLDLNFDGIPELALLHDSGGSMGGYYEYYYYDAEKTDSVQYLMTKSIYVTPLADLETKNVYMFREMYLLVGNFNGYYGSLDQITSFNGKPVLNEILNLEVDDTKVPEQTRVHYGEDDCLSDYDLEVCIETTNFQDGVWNSISFDKYIEIKRKFVPKENDYVNLFCFDEELYILKPMYDVLEEKIEISEKEIIELFDKWKEYIKKQHLGKS